METEYGIGGFTIKREGSRFHVFCGQNKLDSFNDFKAASQLLSDLHLSKKASDDEKIGVKAFCPSAFENGSEVIVVAKVDGGYVVQPIGTTERMTVAEEYLSDVPRLFAGDDEDYDDDFAEPGSGSALRSASPKNPRNLPCPTCGEPNRLTPADRARGYQCNECANIAERGW